MMPIELNECKRVVDLRETFVGLDQPVQRREFQLSQLMVLLSVKTHVRYLLSNTSKCVNDLHSLSGT